jgi:hypothetical protein
MQTSAHSMAKERMEDCKLSMLFEDETIVKQNPKTPKVCLAPQLTWYPNCNS